MNYLALMLLQDGGIARGVDSVWAALATPVIILFAVAALGLLLRTGSKRYMKVPPDRALVLYGKGQTQVVTGGAKFVMPIFYDFHWMDLRVFQFDLPLNNVPNADGVQINVKAIATCKISSETGKLKKAAESFGKDAIADIQRKVQNALEGHLRVVIGQMDMNTILRKRDEFNQRILQEAATEVGNLGCEITILNIQEVSDAHGYIDALGKPKTAEVLADANIKAAEQKRRETVATTNADREGSMTRSANEAQIAEAERDRDIKRAKYAAEVQKEQATAAQAGPLAEAEARKAVVAAEVDVKKSQTLAEIDLQEAVGRKTQAELAATILKQADAEKQRMQTVAEGQKSAALINAEAAKQKLVIEADGAAEARQKKATAERQALQLEGEGEAAKALAVGNAAAQVAEITGKANAAATEATMTAEAKGLTAKADALKQELLARAAGVEAELKAQATGMKELVAAYAGLSPEQQRLVQIKWLLEAAPGIVEKVGDAGREIYGELAKVVVAGLSNVDSITVYDSGSGAANGNGGGSALERVMKMAPTLAFEVGTLLKANGVTPVLSGLLNKFGIDVSQFMPEGVSNHREIEAPTPATVEAGSGK